MHNLHIVIVGQNKMCENLTARAPTDRTGFVHILHIPRIDPRQLHESAESLIALCGLKFSTASGPCKCRRVAARDSKLDRSSTNTNGHDKVPREQRKGHSKSHCLSPAVCCQIVKQSSSCRVIFVLNKVSVSVDGIAM